jgi:hypothetical protein
MPERLDEEELADRRAGRDEVYQLAALADRRGARGRRCISRAIFPYLLCRRFIHIKHKVLNYELLATSSGIIAGIIASGIRTDAGIAEGAQHSRRPDRGEEGTGTRRP